MGLLAPLYALAALAIAAPIVFHLIRRQPRGQSEFSSLMFLQPSPPRLTRRSRLDNWLLLLLRGLALLLIALAFSRPFLRSVELAPTQLATREILLLIDVSGSMQRPDVWQRAITSAEQYIQGLGETDELGLATFDTRLQVRLPLTSQGESASSPKAQQAAVLAELGQLKPGYQSTRLAQSLMAAVELLQERSTSAAADELRREIVLISDLHESSDIDALQGFDWPEAIRLDIRRISPAKVGNARATLMQAVANESDVTISGASSSDQENKIRVRIENNQASSNVDFQLQWVGQNTLAPTRVQVPPGQARVVPVALPAGQLTQLQLSGDEATFDNLLDVPRTAARQERIALVGTQPDKPEDDLFFFLSQVPFSTAVRTVTLERMKADQVAQAIDDPSLAGLAIEAPLATALVSSLEKAVRAGKPVVVVLARPIAADAPEQQATAAALSALLGTEEPLKISEAAENKFALWTEIDFRHPLFLPLADAKYNDFGKVRFWNYRQLNLPTSGSPAEASSARESSYRVLARFEDHSPAVIHRKLGLGDLWILTAGWQATSSQLALSTKFVPLMYGMFDLQGRAMVVDAVYEVGEPIPVAQGTEVSVSKLDGTQIQIAGPGKLALDTPGLYWLVEDGKRRQVSVILPLSESQLDPLDTDRFEQYGVVTGKSNSAEEQLASARLSQSHELESRQKLWRWILVAAIGILIGETVLGAWTRSLKA